MVDLANFKFPLKTRNLDEKYDHVAVLYLNGIVEEKVDTMEIPGAKSEPKKIKQEGQNIVINFARKQSGKLFPDVVCVRIFEVQKGNKNGMMPAVPFAEYNMIINETVQTGKKDVVVDFWIAGERVFSHEERRFLDPEEDESGDEIEEAGSSEEVEEEEEEEESSEEEVVTTRAKKPSTQPKTPSRRS